MRIAQSLFRPARVFRHLSIGWKLTLFVASGVGALASVSWFALDRLIVVGALQDGVAEQAALGREMQHGLLAALELRVVSRELPLQQTVASVNRVAEQADQAAAAARQWLGQARKAAKRDSDRTGLDQALAKLDDTAATLKKAAGLRADMLVARQKRLFQNRPVFEASAQTFAQELARGGVMLGGADAVRSSGAQAVADQNDPATDAFNRYRLAMSRLQSAAVMFMATGNGSAANEVRDATAEANKAMESLTAGPLSDELKSSARTVAVIGTGIAQAAVELLEQTRQLNTLTREEMETNSKAMQDVIAKLVHTAALRDDSAGEAAAGARTSAVHDMGILIGGIAVVMLAIGAAFARSIGAPMRGMSGLLRAIAAGDTAVTVRFRDRRDEIGQMAGAVETLRGVMQRAFVQSQMIEQIPVPVMTASAGGDFPLTYVNAEAHRVLGLIGDQLPVAPDRIVGQSLDLFYAERAFLADPARLPHRSRVAMGTETLEFTASAIVDSHGAYVGPMITCQVLTSQTRLVARFEDSVGAIADAVGESAETMKQAATAMTEAVTDSGHRLRAVTGASEQASSSVSAAAAGAEELAMSVAEIARRVEESTRIAGQAVREAEATDRSVGGLSASADRIGDVVRLIGDIAARTNLLALNATIEAARAGDAGKGFAVVAGEVKALATQTAKATQEIAAQIDAMRQGAEQAVGALRGIGATIQRMNDIAADIAGSVAEQGDATREIARAVQQAATGTNEVNDNIVVVDRAVAHTGTQSDQVLDAATRLSEQSDTLKSKVRDFLTAIREAA